jgi:hypothetical protein
MVSVRTVTRIIEAAVRAPTGENCQPWKYRWDGSRLEIIHVADRARKQVNYQDLASIFSLGFLFETLRLAASAEGLVPKFTTRLAPDSPVWVKVEFEPSPNPPDELYGMLDKRFTDRRPFLRSSLPSELRAEIAADSQGSGCRFYWCENPPKDFVRWTCEAENFFWQNQVFHRDYTRWIRLSTKEALRTRDGVPWWTLGVPYLVSRILVPLKSYGVQQMANRLGFLKIADKTVRDQVVSSAAVCCLTIPAARPETIIEAGRVAMRSWLRCHQKEFGFHPLSLAAWFAYFARLGVADYVQPGLTEKGTRGESILRNCFKYPADELPLWVFRTGRAVDFQGARRTLRLPIEELLTVTETADYAHTPPLQVASEGA